MDYQLRGCKKYIALSPIIQAVEDVREYLSQNEKIPFQNVSRSRHAKKCALYVAQPSVFYANKTLMALLKRQKMIFPISYFFSTTEEREIVGLVLTFFKTKRVFWKKYSPFNINQRAVTIFSTIRSSFNAIPRLR